MNKEDILKALTDNPNINFKIGGVYGTESVQEKRDTQQTSLNNVISNTQKFKGNIVIGDPSYFANSEEDWQKCDYGKQMNEIGFTDFLYIDFSEDEQIIVDSYNKIIGGLSSDSAVLVVVYLDELQKYNPDYEEAFFSEDNRTVIYNFDGEVSYENTDDCVVITGKGNINFKSCYSDDIE